MLWRIGLCVVLGYLSGSILFCPLVARLLGKRDLLARSRDGNPGTANAFMYGGALCGILTLLGDLIKGALPILLFRAGGGDFEAHPLFSGLVLLAPVVGHAFPLFFGFRGGKAIAVTFGCLLGLTPHLLPGLILATVFIGLSLGIRVSPHFYRTLATFLVSAVLILGWGIRFGGATGVVVGFWMITATVCLRLLMSPEKREKPKVRLLWMH